MNAPPTLPAYSFARMLLAEDNVINGELMAAMALRLGVRLDHACDGLEALHMVDAAAQSDNPYILVLMDAMMPVLDGPETARRLRKAGYTPEQLPIIAVTAATAPDEVRSYTEAGMQAYIPKPVRMRDLASMLAAWAPTSLNFGDVADAIPRPSLKARYDERKILVMDRIENALIAGNLPQSNINELLDLLHKLAGTAGSFGEEFLSEAALQCELDLNYAEGTSRMSVLANFRDVMKGAEEHHDEAN